MVLDSGVDLESELQGFAAILKRHDRVGARAHCEQKSFNLCPQWLARFHFGLVECDAGRRAQPHFRCLSAQQGCGCASINANADHVLARIIHREVLVWMKETQLANLLRAHPAGSEVGYATGLKFDTHIRDIYFVADDGQSHRANLPHWRFHQGQTQVKTVDHRSITTSTSSERGVKTLSRCTSKNMG